MVSAALASSGGRRPPARVFLRLLGVARAGDNHADAVWVEDPAKRELREGLLDRKHGPKPLDCLQPDLEWHAGERLADVEGRALAVVVAVVVLAERGGRGVFPGQQTRRE